MADPIVMWDRRKLTRLKRAVKTAKADVITFDGHQLLVAYAKYLIEYLDTVLLGRSRG